MWLSHNSCCSVTHDRLTIIGIAARIPTALDSGGSVHDRGDYATAIAAGGYLVTDRYAPAWWVPADAEGDETCVPTWMGSD